MSDGSKIEWTGATWNPVTGCTKVSPGCDHCYAETFAERWRGIPSHHFETGFDVTLRPERLEQPLRWTRPRRIFVNSMSDLFHDAVPDEYIACVFVVMAGAEQHTFQVLTKRHGRMRSLLNSAEFHMKCAAAAWTRGWDMEELPWPLPNVHLGVSVEDQHWANIRIPALLDTPAAVRFISAEPLLGHVRLEPRWLLGRQEWGPWYPEPTSPARIPVRDIIHKRGLDWVIAGGESGPGARRCEIDWLQSLRGGCAVAGVPFFCKQLGSILGRELGAGPKGGDWDAWPEDLRVREFPRVPESVTA